MKDLICKVLGNKDRFNILNLLYKNKRMTVSELLENMHVGQSYLSQQLSILREDRIVKGEREGRYVIYSIEDEGFLGLMKYLNRAQPASKRTPMP